MHKITFRAHDDQILFFRRLRLWEEADEVSRMSPKGRGGNGLADNLIVGDELGNILHLKWIQV